MVSVVSLLHVGVLVPGLLYLASLDSPPPAWLRAAAAVAAAAALVKHAPRLKPRAQARAQARA